MNLNNNRSPILVKLFTFIVAGVVTGGRHRQRKITNFKEIKRMFKRKKKKENKIEQFSYPIGQAAQMLGISKRTLLRRASAIGLEFEFDGRGRRVLVNDIQRLLSGGFLDNKKSDAFFEEESDKSLNNFDEEGIQAAYELKLPKKIRVWQRFPSGKGTVLRGDLFCDESYGFVHELIKQRYGPGEYVIRTIENGVLSKGSYKVLIAGEPWNKKEAQKDASFSGKFDTATPADGNSQSKKEKQISQWLDPFSLRLWWISATMQPCNQKCSLTAEDFISARRSFKQYLDQIEEDEFELITGLDAREIFFAHVQRLCQQKEQADDARIGDAQVEEDLIGEIIEDIKEDMDDFEKEQSEQNLLLLFCLFGMIILLAPQLGQILEQILKQKPEESDHKRPKNNSTRSGDVTTPAGKHSSSILDGVSLIPVDIVGDGGISAIV